MRRYVEGTGLASLAKKYSRGVLRKLSDEKKKKVLEYCGHVAEKRRGVADKAHLANRYLTNQEELQLVQICCCLSAIGHGISKRELLNVVNDYQHEKAIDGDYVPASDKYMRGLFKRHKSLVKICGSSSMDPQRAKQATEETRDAQFVKLDNYIKMLYEAGAVPWANFCEIPPDHLFNMDEVGTDTTKHRTKLIADATLLCRVFQVTPEGDGKMNIHITACITTCGNGLYCFPKDGISGAPAPLVIYTEKSSTKEKEHQEREQQRLGKKAVSKKVAPRFLVGLGSNQHKSMVNEKDPNLNPFGFKIATTSTGSMTHVIKLGFLQKCCVVFFIHFEYIAHKVQVSQYFHNTSIRLRIRYDQLSMFFSFSKFHILEVHAGVEEH